jgi:hypothetical protein
LGCTVNGNTVRSFSTHGHQSAAKGSSTTASRSDIRFIQHLDSSALCLLVRRWRLVLAIFLSYITPVGLCCRYRRDARAGVRRAPHRHKSGQRVPVRTHRADGGACAGHPDPNSYAGPPCTPSGGGRSSAANLAGLVRGPPLPHKPPLSISHATPRASHTLSPPLRRHDVRRWRRVRGVQASLGASTVPGEVSVRSAVLVRRGVDRSGGSRVRLAPP